MSDDLMQDQRKVIAQPDTPIEPFALAVRKLLQGVVYFDDRSTWTQILDYEYAIRTYLGRIGLGVYLDRIGGFAYLSDTSRDDENRETLPALTRRLPLRFAETLLCVLLRERLDEHERRDLDNDTLIVSEDEIGEMLRVFLGDHPDARQVERVANRSSNKLAEYGFLKQVRSGQYRVMPVLRARISGDELKQIKAKLTDYVGNAADSGESVW